MQHHKTTSLLLCALFTALIVVSAFIRIPAPLVPITLQSGMVLFCGILLGPKYGSISVMLYVLLGLCGVPVFAMGGGFGYVLQPTFGYLIGFILGAYVTGAMTWRHSQTYSLSVGRLFAVTICGLIVIYTVGTVYCYGISVWVLGSALAFWPLFLSCIVLPLPGDLALCLLAAILGNRLLPHTKKYIR